VKTETMQEHDMHTEWIEVERHTIEQLIAHLDSGIVAVGTTSLRTIESLYWLGCRLLNGEDVDFSGVAVTQWLPYEMELTHPASLALQALIDWLSAHRQSRIVTRTQILIAPDYTFKIAKGLVTNFHQPNSTLLLLVAAFVGENWRSIYDHALQQDNRFLSYGDGSLLWR
jgi:S-adenosylmethionine:tRNA ribosyltransferase-isomerase